MTDERKDPLRERLAATELIEARALLGSHGVGHLVVRARQIVEKVDARRRRFDELSGGLSVSAGTIERRRRLEAYLRETSPDSKTLARDLRALERDGLDIAALGERLAIDANREELRAEALLAVARDGHDAVDVDALVFLATHPGRWSRRVEALGLLSDLAKRTTSAVTREKVARAARRLSAPTELRWVQASALATLATVSIEEAVTRAQERLELPSTGDDFIVRAQIVELAARLEGDGGSAIVARASSDPSDLVRMYAARFEKDAARIRELARSDASYKVRAVALLSLAKREGPRAVDALDRALRQDPNGFVVQLAAEEVVVIARTHAVESNVLDAIAFASRRPDVEPAVRSACADALLEVDVLSTPSLRAVHDALAPLVQRTTVGEATNVRGAAIADVSDEDLARVLAVLAKDDFALGVDRTAEGVVLYRGERRGFAPWRAIFELTHPAPSKRQAFDHTLAWKPRGALRAPPGRMAELTATRVPGERVRSDLTGGWGRHLPLVADLLLTGVVSPKRSVIVSAHGLTTVEPARTLGARLRAWLSLTFRYDRFVEARRRSLDSPEPAVRSHYLTEVARRTGIAIRFTPFAFGTKGAGPSPVELGGVPEAEPPRQALALVPLGAALSGLVDSLRETGHDLATYALSPVGNRLPQLAAYSIAMLGALLIRGVTTRHGIDQDRKAIPLVIGGWGTRGKSGTERLKAAMFQGLGYETLVKTTGCEAMFIHAIPGVSAREIFLYRPYDKASIWEQRDVLALARRLRTRVFLWECMALQPDLVGLLQSQWMRDDCSTITNAYPDHEDVQGPSGFDVATVISEFVPTAGKLFTSEDEMLPIVRERAKERGSTLRAVGAREAELISDDLLARFPYQEHPRNIALVAALARGLGTSSLVATVEMAENVVPDLGVLKTYPTVTWRGRTLTFTNGMSANERTGALANWRRAGFDTHEPDADPRRWIVTVVNNRADRIARSEVFARFLVEDIAAHRHVLIGTNVSGLLGFIQVALERHLDAISPTRELDGDTESRRRTAVSRIRLAFARLHVGAPTRDSVVAEIHALGLPEIAPDDVEKLLASAHPDETHAAATEAVRNALLPLVGEGDHLPFLARTIVRRRVVRSVVALADRQADRAPVAVERAFRSAYRALFEEGLLALHDASLSGDAILDRIARSAPPGAHVTIMGVQNIKGTGLDFVYRWVSIDMVHRTIARLSDASRDERERALTELMIHDDFGLLDASFALAAVEEAHDRQRDADDLPFDAVAQRLRDIVATRTQALNATRKPGLSDRARKVLGETLDFVDAVHRRRLAVGLLEELVAGRVSHAAAAVRMRAIVARTKGAWMLKRRQ